MKRSIVFIFILLSSVGLILAQMHSKMNTKRKGELIPFTALWSEDSSDMAPSLAPDGKYVVFQSNRDIEDRFSLYESYLDKSGRLSNPTPIILDIRAGYEGQPYFSGRDGWLLYASIGPRNMVKKKGDDAMSDIWLTLRQNKGWSKPYHMPAPINTVGQELTPCISADGTTLYFASDRPGGFGGLDIWSSRWNGKDWSKPKNLGRRINSKRNEIFPRIHADGKTLYFSSNRKTSIGGYDIYIARFKRNSWSKVVNAGEFINTKTNDYLNGIPADASYLLLSRGNINSEKIFKLTPTPKFMMPTPLGTTRIIALDNDSKSPIPMKVRITDLRSNKVILRKGYTPMVRSPMNVEKLRASITNKESYFSQVGMDVFLETPGHYGIFIMSKGYLFLDEEFTLTGTQHSEHVKIFELPPLRKGAKLPMRSVYFASRRASLLKKSKESLLLVVDFLQKRKSIVVEIQGHTAKGRGSERRNKKLSKQRAKAVRKFLIKKGVNKKRIRARGFGSKHPVAANDTEANMKKNRRVEFLILDILKPKKKRKKSR